MFDWMKGQLTVVDPLAKNKQATPQPWATRIQVTLSRPLTWSERETFNQFVQVKSWGEHRFNLNPDVFEVDSHLESRRLAWEIHHVLAEEFFNVHIKSVFTKFPRVKV